jgi:DNA-binding Xre family transcriptional regulator
MDLIGNIAKNIRKRTSNYSELARRSGVPLSTIQKIIYRQKKDIQLSTINAIAKALKVRIEDLLK